MKIIGKTSGGFIIEASEREIAKLTGWEYEGNRDYPVRKLGDEIAVNTMFDRLYLQRSNEKDLEAAATILEKVVGTIRKISPTVKVATGQPD